MSKVNESEIKTAKVINGKLLHQNSKGLWVDSEGDSGWHSHFTGAWVCYKCGQLCECGEGE